MVKMRTFRISQCLAKESEASTGFGIGLIFTSRQNAFWAITSNAHRMKYMVKAGEQQLHYDSISVHYDLAKWLQVTE